jgi:hypothetical protein
MKNAEASHECIKEKPPGNRRLKHFSPNSYALPQRERRGYSSFTER